jgi:hypothetical protein
LVDLCSLNFFDKFTTNQQYHSPQVQVQLDSNSDDFFDVDNESKEASAKTQESLSTYMRSEEITVNDDGIS